MNEKLYKQRCSELIKLGDYTILNDYNYFSDFLTEEEFKEIIRRKQNRKNKRYRVKDIMKAFLEIAGQSEDRKLVFCTFTLNKKMQNNCDEYVSKKLNQYLKNHYMCMVINKDYGDKNKTPHYHGIGITTEELVEIPSKSKKGGKQYKLKTQDYTLGHEPTMRLINTDEIDKTRNYLLKLNNHANKETTSGRIRVIYNWKGLIALEDTTIKCKQRLRKVKEKRIKELLNKLFKD